MISEELKSKNINLFFNKLNNLGIDTEKMEATLKDKLENASFSMNADSNCAYDGSLIHIVLRTFTPIAIKLNEILPEEIRVDLKSLIKVCLLINISKSEMFVKNDNQWEVEKRGILYKYAKSEVALKMGARSILLCQELGITFTPEEFEAMLILDKDDSDLQSKFYSNPLSVIIKQANELTHLNNRIIFNKNE